ncbi:hypothetical protein [Haladaptatus sp. DYF46]|uniref:hypothetical protein n=1 Tax=Haladaptatus sp. DYF46 TaxID=2886041 RepID=UPI001E4BFE7C|nr:hypothetical protein [Haladaptatus sp. DYF46]
MFGQVQRMKEFTQMAQNPTESEQVQALVNIIAALEHQQLAQVEQLHAALDIDGIERTKDQTAREAQLIELIDALAAGNLKGYWLNEVASEHLENPVAAKSYLGLSPDEWEEQQANWAADYREKAPEQTADMSDREIAQQHVTMKFGCSLDEFEREIVEWSMGSALERLLASNFQAVSTGIEAATAELTETAE